MAIGRRYRVQEGLSVFLWFFIGLLMVLFNHDGYSGSRKGSQHMAPEVPGRDPTLIHADPPEWSRQACLWPQYDHLWPFWAVLRSYGAPNGHSGPGNRSKHIAPNVPGLDPALIHADPPVWSHQTCLWPHKGHLGPFRAISGLFLAIDGRNCWIKSGAEWITTQPNPNEQIQASVFPKQQLR